jgi:hypothetical protein
MAIFATIEEAPLAPGGRGDVSINDEIIETDHAVAFL